MLGTDIAWIALIFYRPTLIPKFLTTKPSNFSDLTPNVYFERLNFNHYLCNLSKSFLKIWT
jgi:hypothetical protein